MALAINTIGPFSAISRLFFSTEAQQAHDDHQTLLVIFGLLVSVPFIVFGSQVVLKLLDRFPVIVWIGGGLLGWIGGGLITSDGFVVKYLPNAAAYHYPAAAAGAVLVVVLGWIFAKRAKEKAKANQLQAEQ